MRKLILLLLLSCTALACSDNGRYQMSEVDGEIYILDTKTSDVRLMIYADKDDKRFFIFAHGGNPSELTPEKGDVAYQLLNYDRVDEEFKKDFGND